MPTDTGLRHLLDWSCRYGLSFAGRRAAQPQLGLMTVAALLPPRWNDPLLNTNVERLELSSWMRGTIATDDDTQETTRAESLRQTQNELDRINKRLEAMYLEKLDGRVTNEFYDQKATEWRQEQNTLTARINDHRKPSAGYQAAIDAIQTIRNLCESYVNLPPQAKRALLHAILRTANWQHAEFRATPKAPFAQFAHSNQGRTRKQTGKGRSCGQTENWLIR